MSILKFFNRLFVGLVITILSTVVIVFDVLLLLPYLVIQQPWIKWKKIHRPRSVSVPASNGTIIRKSTVKMPDHFIVNCKTIDEAVEIALKQHGPNRECIGYREVIERSHGFSPADNKPITKLKLTDYKWVNFGQFYEQVVRFGHGLSQLGASQQDKVIVYADTSARWNICAHAIIKNGSILTTLYSTLSEQGIIQGINETESQYILTSKALIQNLINLNRKKRLDYVKCIVILDIEDAEQIKQIQSQLSQIKLISYSSVVDSGDINYYSENPVTMNENDVAIIMYTSGSGGIPKGVMITHRNFIRGMWSTISLIGFFLDEIQRHTYIAYLPLAHILEFGTETFLLIAGAKIGYSSPYTLTDLSPGLAEGTKGDATLLRPTLMTSVPLVLDRIRKAIYTSLNNKGLLAVRLFEFIIEYKTFWMSKGFTTPILDALFLAKFSQIVGGKLEILMAGGAPLSADTQKLIRACLNVTFSQGYGATETCSSGLFMNEHDQSLAKVGGPYYGMRIKLIDWKEGGYCTNDKPNPRGEIHLATESLSVGYFNLEKLTADTYYIDDTGVRWFKTGDIGELCPNGTFKIIDRKKDFIKLPFGEYISLGKIETKLKTSYLVNNVCVIGNPLYRYLVAIVIPNGKVVEKMASRVTNKNGLLNKQNTVEQLYENDSIVKWYTRKLRSYARFVGLRQSEIPKAIVLVGDEWTPECGLVTASFKLKRKNIELFYANRLQQIYSEFELELVQG